MPSNIQPLRRDPKADQQILHLLNTFVVTFHREANGRDMSRTLCALFETHPELVGFDLIENLMDFSGEVSQTDVETIAECYAARRVGEPTATYTVIATHDANYRFWVPAMDHFFPGRRHLVATSLEDAWDQLNHLRGR